MLLKNTAKKCPYLYCSISKSVPPPRPVPQTPSSEINLIKSPYLLLSKICWFEVISYAKCDHFFWEKFLPAPLIILLLPEGLSMVYLDFWQVLNLATLSGNRWQVTTPMLDGKLSYLASAFSSQHEDRQLIRNSFKERPIKFKRQEEQILCTQGNLHLKKDCRRWGRMRL